jgi:hypothetical protein
VRADIPLLAQAVATRRSSHATETLSGEGVRAPSAAFDVTISAEVAKGIEHIQGTMVPIDIPICQDDPSDIRRRASFLGSHRRRSTAWQQNDALES